MKITVIGTGYVGLVSGACFASIGHEVACIDINEEKVATLKNGQIPFFEPGLSELVTKAVGADKLKFSIKISDYIDDCEAIFIAVGTPQDEDGSADMQYVLAAAKEICELKQKSKSQKLTLVTKSTVPVGTADKINKIVADYNLKDVITVASNPEFLREGCAVKDFMEPDRIVIGCDDEESEAVLTKIYDYFDADKIFKSSTKTAELIKYAANSFLATKISFINEMADLCEKTGADIKELAAGIGLDSRIGNKFLNPGPGYGGSCFPKDVAAILHTAKEYNSDLSVIAAADSANKDRKISMADRISATLNNDNSKKIAVLGLAFKSNTDDIRYSPAIKICEELLEKGFSINATDFEAIKNSKKALSNFDNITFYDDLYKAVAGCDLLAILTEWEEYRDLDLQKIKTLMSDNIICDFRNMLNKNEAEKAGFKYDFIGNKND